MKNEYKLFNRDKIPVSLKLVSDNNYELIVDVPYEPMFNVSKLGDEYVFIDPPGGPLIARGGHLPENDNVIIEHIYYGEENKAFMCVLKEIKNEQQNTK